MIQPLIDFFKIIRWKNVLIYLTLEFLLYFVLAKKDFSVTDAWLFLTLSITCFGIFGNIQNNFSDYEVDRQKKDFVNFNLTTYLILTIMFMVLGLLFGFTGFYMSFKTNLLYTILSIPILLSFYNYYLKKIALAGNLLIGFLIAIAIYVPIVFAKNIQIDTHIFYLLLTLAFWLTFIRELAKDLEDKEYDQTEGYKTLPVINENISRYLLIFFSFLTPVLLLYFNTYFDDIYFNILLIFNILSAFGSSFVVYKKKYESATRIYKLWMLIGMFSTIYLQ